MANSVMHAKLHQYWLSEPNVSLTVTSTHNWKYQSHSHMPLFVSLCFKFDYHTFTSFNLTGVVEVFGSKHSRMVKAAGEAAKKQLTYTEASTSKTVAGAERIKGLPPVVQSAVARSAKQFASTVMKHTRIILYSVFCAYFCWQ